MTIAHKFVSAIADDPAAVAAGEVVPSNWNDAHTKADLTTDVTGKLPAANLADTAVIPATYGDSTHVSQITVDQQGRITAASSVAISTGGTGTVTSVATGVGLTGGPITTTGQIDLANVSAVAHKFFSAVSGNALVLSQPDVSDLTGLGTGVATALGVNTGSAGAFVLFGGALGTPSSGTATNLTGTAAGLTAGTVTTNANLTGPITSSGNATSIASQTGTGSTFAMSVSPALTGSPTAPTQTTGDNSTKIATDAFVTTAIANAVAGTNPAIAVQAATTQASDTSGLTYNNGVSGIGATLTGSNNTAITWDGFTFTALGQRGLVKNDTQSPSGAFNGAYYVTQVQTAILPPILTRALDYDQPSDINNTGAIPVVNGTVNANTSWLLTSAVTTVGTDPLTYTQFSLAPSTLVTLTGTQTLTNKRVTKRAPSITQSATPTINTDNTDYAEITGLAQAITSMTTNLSGTPVKGDTLWVSITDNGTARGITWGTSFEASTVALPTTTVLSTRLDIGFTWNVATSKWRCVAVA